MEGLVVVLAFFLAIVISELALKGKKLQTGLTGVVTVHAAVAASLVIYCFAADGLSLVAVLVFWSGAFLTWFGVRSHIESSILLRMLFLLRGGSMSGSRLLEEYESHYGESLRLKELFDGGLLEETPEGIIPTSKGRFILRIVALLQ